MNVYDSEQIKNILTPVGYYVTDVLEDADVVIVNTCAIRHKAEQKALSFLGRMAELKIRNPMLIVAVGGCVAQQYGKSFLKRMPYIDLVFGNNALCRLPELLSRVVSSRCKIVDIENFDQCVEKDFFHNSSHSSKKVSAFVTVIRGCDNYCSYCIVPYVRGREVSRTPKNILEEVRELVSSGVKEVVLLGQNVNSYGGMKEKNTFVNLLAMINDVVGLERIRFTTSNPKDLSDDLIDAFCSIDKLCKHLHLPVQSGDNIILKRMNRGYTRESYIDKVTKLRQKCSGISITSDFIVGFPGESDLQFEATLDLISLIKFDSSFVFSYSDRPNVASSKFSGKITEEVKRDRLQKLLALQNKFTTEKNFSMIDDLQEVLVEGEYCRNDFGGGTKCKTNTHSEFKTMNHHWFGRTSNNRIVYFEDISSDNCTDLKGNIVNVRITGAKIHSLYGVVE